MIKPVVMPMSRAIPANSRFSVAVIRSNIASHAVISRRSLVTTAGNLMAKCASLIGEPWATSMTNCAAKTSAVMISELRILSISARLLNNRFQASNY
jgi:hypothetical protein